MFQQGRRAASSSISRPAGDASGLRASHGRISNHALAFTDPARVEL